VKLAAGLYEALITRDRAAAMRALRELLAETQGLSVEAAPHVLARHLSDLLIKALRNVPGDDKLDAQVALANRMVELLAEASPDAGVEPSDGVESPAQMLLSMREAAGDRLGTGEVVRPSIPLRHSDLIVNGPRDLRLGNEIRAELPSADRVDLLVAFLKWSGLRIIKAELDELCRRRPGGLRVLTTTYLGASEVEALDALADLGAEVRVSYDSRRTRLHAKAWIFHRNTGFSTALVGSSNLSRSAMLDGCEWNVRLSAVDNAAILAKFQATFEQYWDEGEFEPYDRERFLAETERRDAQRDALARALHLRPYPHQQHVLDALGEERAAGHHRNLVVAATGTGKTVVAALDYARLRKERGEATLLFVAHRREILQQSLATFRAAVRDGHFGELMVDRHRPTRGQHVFASIQSLHADRLAALAPDAYDVVIVDEFHHAEAPTYRALLEHLRPQVLLGLTATPERADGKSILGWFDGRIAAELRLWDSLDLGLLVPFQYFGVHDGTDLSWIDWRSGRYDVATLEKVYTADDLRAAAVLRAIDARIRDPRSMRALGFCVSVKHAEFMAEYCRRKGLPAVAVSGDTAHRERDEALRKLRAGEINLVFTVDLFNEGVDVPAVDTVLFLRPTESATIFLQQLGRGLRLAEDKDCLTVLDFIGTAHRKFRFDRRYRALVGGTHAQVRRQVEQGFPHLPAGCEIQLDRESREAVLHNIRSALPSTVNGLAEDLAAIGDVGLRAFLDHAEIDLPDLYRNNLCFTALEHRAGLRSGEPPDSPVTRALGRLLHIDDVRRLDTWRGWLARDRPPEPDPADPLQLMLFAGLGHVRRPVADLGDAFAELWALPGLRGELAELLDELADRRRRPTAPMLDLPFHVHATYSRDEISAGLRQTRRGKLLRTQGGVYKDTGAAADILFVTLDKDEKEFTPTTLYEDYPISPTRFHWESQSVTRADSATGRRYQEHAGRGWRILLFVRQRKRDDRGVTSPYLFLGPVRYLEHESEKPMRIIWELERPMPPEFFQQVKVAAG
jgi:superfamily II DNA or RNA helicase